MLTKICDVDLMAAEAIMIHTKLSMWLSGVLLKSYKETADKDLFYIHQQGLFELG